MTWLCSARPMIQHGLSKTQLSSHYPHLQIPISIKFHALGFKL